MKGTKQMKEDASKWRAFIEDMQTNMAEKYGTDVFYSLGDPEKIVELAKRLEGGTEKKTVSTGTISLLPKRSGSELPELFGREYPETPQGAKQLIYDLYESYRNETDPTKKEQLANAIQELLQKKAKRGGFGSREFDLEPVPEGLPNNFDWRQYTAYMQKKSKEAMKNE